MCLGRGDPKEPGNMAGHTGSLPQPSHSFKHPIAVSRQTLCIGIGTTFLPIAKEHMTYKRLCSTALSHYLNLHRHEQFES